MTLRVPAVRHRDRSDALACEPDVLRRRSAQALRCAGGRQQGADQVIELTRTCPFGEGGRDILCGAAHLVQPVGQVGRLIGAQDDGVRRQVTTIDRVSVLVRPLPAGMRAVPAPSPETLLGRQLAAAPVASQHSGTPHDPTLMA